MRNICLILSYDGTHFLGWQKTAFGRSVEEVLQNALEKVLQHKVSLQAASRTDAGVHAEGQIVNFCTENTRYSPLQLHRSLLALLPTDMAVLEVTEKATDFHPTLSSKGKIYRYSINTLPYQPPCSRLYSWHFSYPIDISKMEEASKLLIGKHDFTAFCNDSSKTLKDPICHLSSIHILKKEGDTLIIELFGDRFLYKMVRNIVGTLAYIGAGKLPISSITQILANKDRTQAGITAPAHGLSLYKVIY